MSVLLAIPIAHAGQHALRVTKGLDVGFGQDTHRRSST